MECVDYQILLSDCGVYFMIVLVIVSQKGLNNLKVLELFLV